MKRAYALLMSMAVLSGCANKEDGPRSAALAQQGPSEQRHLALEHRVELDAPEDKIGPIYEATKAACARVPQRGCTVLQAQVDRGDTASASVKMRATPDGVRAVLASVTPQGKLVQQSSSAEDLAKPLQDSARQIAMLTTYRSKLETLAQAPDVDTDALIKLHRELAEVQSQLEAMQGQQAHLNLRVQTELLTVWVSEGRSVAFGKPIGKAVGEFASTLSQGVAFTISAIAFLIPAGLAIALLAALWKFVRRRVRRGRGLGTLPPAVER